MIGGGVGGGGGRRGGGGGRLFAYLTRGACTNNGTKNPRFWSTRILDMGLFCN